MLAVTEVNGCAPCSYGHTRMALDAGLSTDEVRGLLTGATGDVPADELGIAFSQHYAAMRGHPDPTAWPRVVEAYGDAAMCTPRAVRMMWAMRQGYR